MRIPGLALEYRPLQGAVPASLARVDFANWEAAARLVREAGGRIQQRARSAGITDFLHQNQEPSPTCHRLAVLQRASGVALHRRASGGIAAAKANASAALAMCTIKG